jgi:acyl carrier protein
MRHEIGNQIIFLLNDNSLRVSEYESLVSSGLLSSLQIVELAVWLEEKYHVRFSENGFNVYDFESVATISEMINRMQKPG